MPVGIAGGYLTLEEAARLSGLHEETLRRLLRAGVLDGHKAVYRGKRRWLVSEASLRQYADPVNGFLLELPGPKLYLKRAGEASLEEDGGKE